MFFLPEKWNPIDQTVVLWFVEGTVGLTETHKKMQVQVEKKATSYMQINF